MLGEIRLFPTTTLTTEDDRAAKFNWAGGLHYLHGHKGIVTLNNVTTECEAGVTLGSAQPSTLQHLNQLLY